MYQMRAKGWLKHIDFMMLDVVSLHIAFLLAYFVRFGFANPYASNEYLVLLTLSTIVDFAVLVYNESLKNVLKRGFCKEITETVRHVFWVEILIVLYLFTAKISTEYSRIVVYLFGFIYAVLSYLIRISWKGYLLSTNALKQQKACFVIATGERLGGLFQTLKSLYGDKLHMVGACVPGWDGKQEPNTGLEILADLEEVAPYLCREWVDEVFISVPENDSQIQRVADQLSEMGVVVHMEVLEFSNLKASRQIVERMGNRIVLTTVMNFMSVRQAVLKRVIDIVIGLAGCLATVFLTVILGPLIFWHSPGPIFFSQTRIGRNGKKFVIYKFRSMYLDAEERKRELEKENRIKDGMMFKLEYDPRIIGCRRMPDGTVKKGIGNFIRDWSLDEFPQFFNVLAGTMSICGTRPPTEDEWVRYELPYRSRLAVKPGITGLWQVSGRSDITDFEKVVEMDKQYIREWSLGLDCRIILKTISVVLRRNGAM